MISEIFNTILYKLNKIRKDAPWAYEDEQVKTRNLKLIDPLTFLHVLCIFLEECEGEWEWDDEESRSRLRSTVTAFKLLWAESSNLNLNLLFDDDDVWPVDAEAFYSLVFALEGLIQKSKLLVELWCEYILLSSSSSLQPKNPDSPPTDLSFIRFHIRRIPKDRAVIEKLAIMDKVMSVPAASCSDSDKLLRILKFAALFYHKATYLQCLYWATKQGNKEETATDTRSISQNLQPSSSDHSLHSLIPYAPDIIVLISQNLQPCSSHHSFLLSATVPSWVDFFFDHLDDDHFLILRDPLIRLFTSLSYAAEEEDGLLRSQAYALFREHSYLLLPHGDKKKMLLNDFITQIEIANAKIKHLYCGGFSVSRVSSEAEKLGYMYFVSIAVELYLLEEECVQGVDRIRSQLRSYGVELKFMRAFFQCLATWEHADNEEDIMARLNFIITSLQGIWQKDEAEKGLLAARFNAIRRQKEVHGGDFTEWHPLAFELQGKIQTSKMEIEAWCIRLLHLSFQSNPLTINQTVRLLDSMLDILNDLVTHKAGEIFPFKKQIETLEEKLLFLKNILILITNCTEDSKDSGGFRMFVQAFASDAACLTFLFWSSGKFASKVSPILSHMLPIKINPPVTPDVAKLYFKTLKAVYLQQSDSLLFGHTASFFVDLFIENHLGTPSKDDFQNLHDELIFLLTFLNDPPNSEEVIDDLFWEDVFGFLPFDDTEADFIKKQVLLNDFIFKIGTVNAKMRQLYCEFPDASLFNFPKLVSPLFLDFIINNVRNLKERMITDRKYVPFAKYKIIQIEEELVSIRPFFNYVFDFQSELKETWSDVVDFVHLSEHVISSSISSWFVFDHPIWYHMARLSHVIDRIKVVKTKLEKIKENTMYHAKSLPDSASIISTPSEQARPSHVNELVVGFEDEAEKIIGMLTDESKSLETVSIVGMGGLGKTTIARKVYNSVKGSFDVFAFSYISQDYNTRRLLYDILFYIKGRDDRLSEMTKDDLAHELWKCLSRQKYLIVLDDIWDIKAWDDVKSSFPDHKQGSRVMFTTRLDKVADNCKISCDPHRLRFLSEVESWELFQRKVFHDGNSPPYLYEVGRLIVRNCKGLPLAVAVIAGLLVRTEKSLQWWREVAENVVSYLSDEGCMKILELSYKNLPEILKPCLLYLSAFREDSLIRVKTVILLWIAEGFVQESKVKSLYDVAKDYFHDLVERSLIIVSARSSNGGIKDFRVHDLIYDLCRKKCREGNFCQLNHGLASSGFSDHSKIEYRRVFIRLENGLASYQLSFPEKREFSLRELRLAQVLYFDRVQEFNIEKLCSLVHLRHIHAGLGNDTIRLIGQILMRRISIPQSICNIWNIRTLLLDSFNGSIHFPATFWRMKSLRHVQVKNCFLQFSDGHDEHDAYPKLDKVVRFSEPVLFTGKDVQRLLQRLPAVQKLSCFLDISRNNDKESVELLDFHSELESLKLTCRAGGKRRQLMNFPQTLKKLTLIGFALMWSDLSAIAELHCLEVLKLRYVSIPKTRLDMEELTFHNLKFFQLYDVNLVEWKASTESLPCLEQLVIKICPKLEDLPPCFGEISTLKGIVLQEPAKVLKRSAFQIQDELIDLGIQVKVLIK